MATRVNTKFVVILAAALVLVVCGAVFAVMKLNKGAADYVKIAEESMQLAEQALKSGDIEMANSMFERAAKNYAGAKQEDARNTSYLYSFIDAHERKVCDDLTLAYNELNAVFSGAVAIHDTPGATVKDREHLYELLHRRLRMGLIVNKRSSTVYMFDYANKWLMSHAGDPTALRYSAIAESYRVAGETSNEKRIKTLEKLTAAITANPDDPWLRSAASRYHILDARRQYREGGRAVTNEINATYMRAYEELNRALELAKDNPPAMVEAVSLIMDLKMGDPEVAQQLIGSRIEATRTLHSLLGDKANRDKLFAEELAQAVYSITQNGSGVDSHPFDGRAYSLALAQAVVEDRPNEPMAYAILGTVYRQQSMLQEAEQIIEKGLAIERLTNGRQYVRDQQARLDMLSNIAELKINLAQLNREDKEQHTALLIEAGKLLEKLAVAPTPNLKWREARIQLLRGRIDFAYGRPAQAIVRFDKANQAYGNSNLQTLQLLAETHRQLRNDQKVIDTYERIVALQPMSKLRLTLVYSYLSQNDDALLARAEAHLEMFLSQKPEDVSAIRLQAGLFSKRGDHAAAIALLQGQDLEKHPELKRDIANYQAQDGDVEGAVNALRAQLAQRPEGQAMNLNTINQLFSYLPNPQAKIDELNRLKTQGLEAGIAAILDKFVRNGRLNMEDELTLLAAQTQTPGSLAINKFRIYTRWNKMDLARAELDRAIQLEPRRPEVIEWRFRIALGDHRWDDAKAAIEDMLDLDIDQHPELAISEGAFMRAQVIAAQAAAMDRGAGRDKMLREAERDYKRALDNYSHYVQGWVQLAKIQLIQDNNFAAQESLREALGLQSRNVQAIELMAQAEMATDDELRALERLEEILRIQPTHPTALNQFTALAIKLGVANRAITQRTMIRDRIPSNTDNRRALALLHAQDHSYDAAKEEIDAVIEREGKTRPNIAVLSQVLILGEKTDRAIEEVTAYLTSKGQSAEWRDHLLMAQTYELSDHREQANTSFAKAIELEGNDSISATLAWAQTLLQRGEPAQAAEIYERLSKAYPANESLKTQTAQVYLNAGEFAKAEAAAMKLPDSPERYQLLIRSALGQEGKLAIAVERARAGVKAFPSHFSLRHQLARLLLGLQNRRPKDSRDFAEPMRLAERLIQDYPNRVEAQLMLADVLLATGNNSKAIVQLEEILEFAPTHIPTNERLYSIKISEAKTLSQTSHEASQTKAAEALAIIAVLIKSRPDLPLLYSRGGEAATLAGLYDQAVDYYRTAFEKTENAQNLASYAEALLATERGNDARSILEDSDHVTMVTNNLYLRALRGRALAASGQADKADALFTNTLRANEDADKRHLLVQQACLAFKHDPQRAVKIVESVLGEDLPANIDIALASLMIGERRYAEAATRLRKYEIEPVADIFIQFSILSQLAIAYQESDQLNAAKSTYEKARTIVRENPDKIPMRQRVHLLNNLAYLLADRLPGFEQKAIQYAQEALDQLPENEAQENVALIEDTLGWALVKAGRLEEAIEILTESVKKYELSANLLHLGRAYLDKGDKNRALNALDRARSRARADEDEKMIAETEKWYLQAI